MDQMQVAINCRSFLRKDYTGIGRYTFNLIKSLSEIDHENRYWLYARRGFSTHSRDISYLKTKNFFVKNDFFKRGPERLLKNIDIYHSPSPEVLSFDDRTKTIVTIHDLIFKTFPQGHTDTAIEDTDKQIRSIVEKASKIICCSFNTLKDLQKYFPVKEEKVAVVHQGVDKNIFYMIGPDEDKVADAFLRSRGVEEPFLLCVGTLEPRKNLKNIFQAFHVLKTKKHFSGKLVVAGMKGWLSDDLEHLLAELNLKDDVMLLGYLTDSELRFLYNKARAFVFPSFYEGFGFPIVEAFCCGVPVVTSNISSCPEVASDAALYVDPHNPESIAQGIMQIDQDEKLRLNLKDRGLKRAGDFNFLKTARETLKIYKEVYSN